MFPTYLRDLLLQQAELTLNLLRQSTLNPWISAWEYFQGPFDFNKTPLRPVGCWILIHAKTGHSAVLGLSRKAGFLHWTHPKLIPLLQARRC